MKKICLALAIVIGSFLVQSGVFAGCFESGGGKLQPGSAKQSELLGSLIEALVELTKEDTDTQLYVVQRPNAYYLKVCNEEEHKRDFRSTYGLRGNLANCQLVCDIPRSIGDGIYSYEMRTTNCPASCSSICYRKCEVN